MKRKLHRVLLIDDDLDERLLTERALKKILPARSTVHLTASGNQAIRYMIGEGAFADRTQFPFPTLIITDLKMADGDGFDVLEFLQDNPAWGVVPRIMFSSSDDDDDIRTAFFLGASAYHLKPGGMEKLSAAMQRILEYWATSEVPPVDESGRIIATPKAGLRGVRYPQLKGGPRMIWPKEKKAARVESAQSPGAIQLL